MDISIFLGKLIGIYLLIVGVLIFVRHKELYKMVNSFAEKSSLLYITGVFILLLGLSMVIGHNVWEFSWRVVITIIGWLTLAKGLMYMFLPASKIAKIAGIMKGPYWYMGGGALSILIGLYLVLKAYTA